MVAPVLSIENVTISYQIEKIWADVVRDVSLQIGPDQIYGLVGESGSGKSTLALAAMRYLATNGRVSSGKILLDGENLLDKSTPEMEHIWGMKMNLVPQDPGGSLNPSIRIGSQLAEITQHHYKLSRQQAWQRGIELLREVRIADPERIVNRYPHQLSGGQQQRVLIAMALSTEPRVLVLDEPTTNLDVTTEATVLDLFSDLIHKHGSATLYVTHNLGVVAQLCDRVAVLYAGEIMEDATVADLFRQPLHPYTLGLLDAIPRLGQSRSGQNLHSIKGQLPSRTNLPKGCVFAPRCPLVLDLCVEVKPDLVAAGEGRTVKCHRWQEIANGSLHLPTEASVSLPVAPHLKLDETEQPLLNIRDVSKRYELGSPLLNQISSAINGKPPQAVKAVDDISLKAERGQTIGLVGESGSGKTTLARLVVGLIKRGSGEIDLMDIDLAPNVEARSDDSLKRLQMVFQNPEESLNPYQTIGEVLRRPMVTLLHYDRERADAKVAELLRAVRLPEDYVNRFPSELSGGEKQRIAIARAFATDPDLVVCDEAVSALDVSVQASILNLLSELKQEHDTSYLFISHDLAVVAYLADVIAVMYLGQLMEIVPRDQLLSPPLHPYTEALLSAIPVPDPTSTRERIRLEADTPSPVNLPTGCRFHTRCPRKWGPICEQQEPLWADAGNGHLIRCHYPLDELAAAQAASLAGITGQNPKTEQP
ncbi:MAG: dipeptide ABC transporter ATP-binding protein [Chloroflexota bacterium]